MISVVTVVLVAHRRQRRSVKLFPDAPDNGAPGQGTAPRNFPQDLVEAVAGTKGANGAGVEAEGGGGSMADYGVTGGGQPGVGGAMNLPRQGIGTSEERR